MPKETIWGDPGTGKQQINAHVIWNRNREVSLGVTPTREGGDPVVQDGYFADLNRSQINRLILVLRRARDSAYGKDE